MRRIRNLFIMFVMLWVAALCPPVSDAADKDAAMKYASSHRWVSSTNCVERALCITLHDGDKLKVLSEGKKGEYNNHKPVWSKTGDNITWFRATNGSDAGAFQKYKTHICVIKADGSGFRKLVDDTNANLNPTWTRDGSNKIIFNRFHKTGLGIKIFRISPDGQMNSEELITAPDRAGMLKYEWAESGLKDGRIFIWRINWFWFGLNLIWPGETLPNIQTYHLLDPEKGTYESVERPNKYPVHKLSVSPTETKVVYMKDLNGSAISYNDCVIAYAEFDQKNLVVKNEVVISAEDMGTTEMYPRWSHDEKYIIYSSSRGGKMQQYMYSLATKETHMVSDESLGVDQYPCFEDLPK